jgi:hypothetical protein
MWPPADMLLLLLLTCCSFSHVLGLDGDPMHVVAAKEMKERGQVGGSVVFRHASAPHVAGRCVP